MGVVVGDLGCAKVSSLRVGAAMGSGANFAEWRNRLS